MDILIKNGTIIDGTGTLRFKADVLVKGDSIHQIAENLSSKDCEVIDATGKIVSPGFIDMHHHADLSLLRLNKAESTLMQGCTTLVVGVCGLGLAPGKRITKKYYTEFVSKTFLIPKMKVYGTLKNYFDDIESVGVSTNLAFFAPHGNIRIDVLGIEDRPANPEELEQMKKTLRQCMEDGAFGMSTGLIYPPGSITQEEEIIELCKVVKEYKGIYDSHMRNEGTGVVSEGMAEIIRVAKETGVQAHISHWKAASSFAWKLTPDMIDSVRKARDDGIDIYVDMYPYEEGSSSLAGVLLKPWVYGRFDENLTNLDTRKRIIDEIFQMLTETFLSDVPALIKLIPKSLLKKLIIIVAKKIIRIISVSKNHHIEGLKLGKALKILYPKRKSLDALLDFLRDEEASIMVSFKSMSEKKSIFDLISQDFVCIGSDGFLVIDANTHPRSYGTFPRILGNYVKLNSLFSLEEGIRKMTGLTASILGLKDRGLLLQNYKADLVVFDPETIIDTSTYEKGTTFPIGIEHVIVNGEITIKNGEHLGTLKGRILKHK